MISRVVAVMAGLVLALSGGAARGQHSLDLEHALALARNNNKDIKAARQRLAVARVGVDQVRAVLLPSLTTQGRYTRNSVEAKLDLQPQGTTVFQPFNQLDFNAYASVPLVMPWGGPLTSAAKERADAEGANYEATETAVLYTTALAFYAAAGGDEVLQARRNAVDVAQKTLDFARARVAAGVVNRLDAVRAEIALARADQAAREAEDVRAAAYDALATLTQDRQPFQLVVSATAAPMTTPLAELASDALERRPEAAAYRHLIESAGLEARANGWRWAPALSGFGQFRAFNYAGFYSQQNYVWAVGLSLDWQLYDGGLRDANRRAAESQAAESAFRLSALRDSINNELAVALRASQTKRRAVTTAERAATLAVEGLGLARAQNEAGTGSQLDLLVAQDTLVAAQVALAQAHFDVALADISVRRAAGLFPDH